mmetsp:Transcript_28863/g.54518  ORF Transcript_28863/g.54518 Transcript_28863/m.54518 type:complete len:295 (+) Transcript_28863:580-1464(+)
MSDLRCFAWSIARTGRSPQANRSASCLCRSRSPPPLSDFHQEFHCQARIWSRPLRRLVLEAHRGIPRYRAPPQPPALLPASPPCPTSSGTGLSPTPRAARRGAARARCEAAARLLARPRHRPPWIELRRAPPPSPAHARESPCAVLGCLVCMLRVGRPSRPQSRRRADQIPHPLLLLLGHWRLQHLPHAQATSSEALGRWRGRCRRAPSPTPGTLSPRARAARLRAPSAPGAEWARFLPGRPPIRLRPIRLAWWSLHLPWLAAWVAGAGMRAWARRTLSRTRTTPPSPPQPPWI